MNPKDFKALAAILKNRSGLVVGDDKLYLLESRLTPVAKKWEVPDLAALAQKCQQAPPEELLRDVTEAMTTNESFFFRDIKPFDVMRDTILPALLKAREATRSIRIWCAACSSGQEPYSIAMLWREMGAKVDGWKLEIVASDISDEMIGRAQEGEYSQFEVQRGLPITLLVKYFSQRGDRWRISDDLRGMVKFEQLNLLEDFTRKGPFDIVFCRNVLIYFDQETKGKVLEQLTHVLTEDGYLYLGGAETVLGITERFQPIPETHGAFGMVTAGGQLKAATG